MAHLVEWIRSVAEKELLDAYHSFQNVYVPGKDVKKEHRRCNDGILHIYLKKPRRIQIIDVGNPLPWSRLRELIRYLSA
jgi:hypothetical protein